MSSFKFQKSALTVSALAGMLFTTQALAQVNNERGSINVAANLITSTCALNVDGTSSTTTTAFSKTLDLGTFSAASVSALSNGTKVGTGVTVVLSLREAVGTAGCVALGSGKWDVLLDLPATAYNIPTFTLVNTTTSGGLTGMAPVLFRQVSGSAGSFLNFGTRSPVGILLSGSTTGPNLNPTDTISLTAEMYRQLGAVTIGNYTANVPLVVLYK